MEKRIMIEIVDNEVKAYKLHEGYREFLQGYKLNFDELFDSLDIEREVDKLSEFVRKIKLAYCEYTIRAIAKGLPLDDAKIKELQEGLVKYCNVRLHIAPKEEENQSVD